MLLKHFFLVAIFAFSLLLPSSSQIFNSGLLQLTPTSASPTYTITLDNKVNDIIISLSAFTSKPHTNCSIFSKINQQANISCTDNIYRLAYLFYEKTPLIYSSTYSFYFLEGKTANIQEYAVWTANNSWTIAEKPKIRAVLSGFVAKDDLITAIELKGLEDGWSINISRSLNVKVVTFSFMLIQNYTPYNLTFVDSQIFKISELTLSGIRANYLNFWGISSLKNSRKNVETGFTVNLTTNSTFTGLGSIDSFSLSDNTALGSLFMINNTYVLSCSSSSYYNVSGQNCIQTCPNQVYTWTLGLVQYQACLTSNYTRNSSLLEQYKENNLDEMLKFAGPGCSMAELEDEVKVVCSSCLSGYAKYGQDCVCELGYYFSSNSCHACLDEHCLLSLSHSSQLLKNGDSFDLEVSILLPKNQTYCNTSLSSFNTSVKINKLSYNAAGYYNQTTQVITIQVPSLKPSENYTVSIDLNSTSELFYIKRQNQAFLWNLSMQIDVQPPTKTEQEVLKSIAPIFSDSDKSIPLILMIAFFLGDKINTFSLFQTVSLIYLVNFMSISQEYNSLLNLITNIFIFQPKPILTIFGSQNSWIYLPKIPTQSQSYHPRVQSYTQNQMFLTIALNSFCSITIQIGGTVGLIKIIKKCLKPSSNQILPEGKYAVRKGVDLSRSEINEKGFIKWKNEIHVRSQAPFRYKMHIYLCVMDEKKWIIIWSLWSMHVLSLSLLLLEELTLPLNSFWTFLSNLTCYTFATLILSCPFVLLRYQPLYLHKCLSLCYKRRSYKNWQLWVYFYLTYSENIIYALIVVSNNEILYQLVGILVLLTFKYIILRGRIKKIETLRLAAIFGFFVVMLVSHYMDQPKTSIMTEIAIGSLLSIISIELLKILRGIVITILKFFQQKRQEPKQEVNKIREKLQVQILKPTLNKDLPSPIQKIPSYKKQNENDFQEGSHQIMTNNDTVQPVYKSKAFRRRLLHMRG